MHLRDIQISTDHSIVNTLWRKCHWADDVVPIAYDEMQVMLKNVLATAVWIQDQ